MLHKCDAQKHPGLQTKIVRRLQGLRLWEALQHSAVRCVLASFQPWEL